MLGRRVSLEAVAAAVLLVAIDGCCRDVPDEEEQNVHDGAFTEAELEAIRADQTDEAERCEAACFELVMREGITADEIVQCEAAGDMDTADPWDVANTEVTVMCTSQRVVPGFCTGRRPQGHHEVALGSSSVGAWFAVHAHLERASVTAFDELADWLEQRGAAHLAARCRAASADEVRHARSMHGFAREAGAQVEDCRAEPAADGWLDVALHNAVEGCVHESFAAVVAAHQAAAASDAAHRKTFDGIAEDELRHGQLAWDLHDWLLARLPERVRAVVRTAMRRALRELPERAASNAASTPAGLGWPSAARARAMATRFAQLLDRPVCAIARA